MKTLALLILLGICALRSEAIGECEVIAEARAASLEGYKGYSLENYACLAFYASNYDTSFQRTPDEFGIVQINRMWCNVGPKDNNPCGIPCSSLLDNDLSDDMKCVKRIVQDPNGLAAWNPWTEYCKDKDLSQFKCLS
ncbi:putative lysozyme C-2 [Microcaecilia unicolor]|uniref:Lysozyme C-2 n=1 Tax=Microcaecilia unicolor TaxID=1415580 RepID=A0A6P7XU91_9AMPH|nr:putative lysozyme C-2 [Microcaecilia unicolor]